MCFWSFLCKQFNKPELNKKMYDAERHKYVKNISQFVLLLKQPPMCICEVTGEILMSLFITPMSLCNITAAGVSDDCSNLLRPPLPSLVAPLRWAQLLKSNNVWRHFCPNFQILCLNFWGFAQIVVDLVWIFNKSKLLGVHLLPPTPPPAPLMAARSIHKTVHLIYVICRRSRYPLKSNPYIFASHQQYFSASAEVPVNIYFTRKATNENVFLSSTPRLKNYFIKCTLCRFIWNKDIISRIMETSYFVPAAGSSAKISLLKISRELKVNFNNETCPSAPSLNTSEWRWTGRSRIDDTLSHFARSWHHASRFWCGFLAPVGVLVQQRCHQPP